MGLFDGKAGGGDLASTAHVAKLLRAPVVLVVDAWAMARSAAAMVHGYATFDPELRLAGVVLNRVGSDAHEKMLRDALGPLGVPVLGVLRRDNALQHPGPAPRPRPRRRAARGGPDRPSTPSASEVAPLLRPRRLPAPRAARPDRSTSSPGSRGAASRGPAGGGRGRRRSVVQLPLRGEPGAAARARGRGSRPSTPPPTKPFPRARTRSTSAAASPRPTPRRWRPTSRSNGRCVPSRRRDVPSSPSAAVSSTSCASSTVNRCAASWTPRPG